MVLHLILSSLLKTPTVTFKTKYTFQERQDASRAIVQERPHRIPIVCEKLPGTTCSMPQMSHRTFTLPSYLCVADVMQMVRFRLKLKCEQTVFLFFSGCLVPAGAELGVVFETLKDEDGWLYVTYASENTFGG